MHRLWGAVSAAGHLMQLGALFLLYLPVRVVAGNPAIKQAVLSQLVEKVGRAVRSALYQLQRSGDESAPRVVTCGPACVCLCVRVVRGGGSEGYHKQRGA